MLEEAERPPAIQKRVCEDRISSFPDDLLIHILLRVPTEDAVATTILSKRWRYVWTMLPKLIYKDSNKSKSVWWFLDQSIRLHEAPILELLCIHLGSQCPVDVDVVNWVTKAIDCCVRNLPFALQWKSEPIRMPKALYTCNTLAKLTLANKILVDAPSPVSLPSLTQLVLRCVVYKDEDTHVRLLSGCPVLKHLVVVRYFDSGVEDNVRKFSVKVPSLQRLWYFFCRHLNQNQTDRSVVIDTPSLLHLRIYDTFGGSYSVANMPHLVKASISAMFHPEDNMCCISSVKYLELSPLLHTTIPCIAVNYSRLTECRICDFHPNWCGSLVVLLSNCPQLTVFMVESIFEIDRSLSENHDVPLLWDQPSSVPKCLSSCLKFFKWTGYAGREDEKEFVRYVVQNSMCLDKAEIWLNLSCSLEEKEKMAEELKDMPKVVTSVLKPDRLAQRNW